MTILLAAHLAVTWAMVGFIWTIQTLHYPLMALVPAEAFPDFEAQHQRRVLVPLALFGPLEVGLAAAVFFVADRVPVWLSVSAGGLLAAIWISTGFFYAPLHGRLAAAFDPRLHRRLVRSNWVRTAAWTVRGLAAAVMLAYL